MKFLAIRALALAVFASGCASAQAEWDMLGTSKSGDPDTYYVDSSTVRREGSRAKVWVLTDYKSAQVRRGAQYRSEQAQFQFDCREETFKTTMVMSMSGQMGEGKPVHTDTFLMMAVPVPPSSIAAALMEVACSASGHPGASREPGASGGYAARIAAAVRPNIVYPDGAWCGNPTAEFDVSLAPDGAIVSVNLRKSSGVSGWDDAAERGLRRTEKLPRDVEGRIFPSLVVARRPKG